MLSDHFIEVQRGPILVTCAYLALYYVFVIAQAVAKHYLFSRGVKDDVTGKPMSFKQVKYASRDPLALCVDRTVGNTLEQMVPFLLSLWLHAMIVSPLTATNYGTFYVVVRAAYPFVFRAGRPWLYFCTLPNYACVAMLLVPVVRTVLA